MMTSLTIGPLTVHMYGFCIALGVIIFMYAIKKNPRFYTIGLENHFDTMLFLGIISGVLGGRILYCLIHHDEMTNLCTVIALWNGGLSILGTLISVIIVLFLYLQYYRLPTLSILDLVSLYAPLIHTTGRIGCFIAGCCHGSLWKGPWSIVYHNPESLAILGCTLHPSQLYSAFAFMIMFIFFYWNRNKFLSITGKVFSLYLLLSGVERFFNEFFRYEYQISKDLISTYQIIGLIFFISGVVLLIKISLDTQHTFSDIKNEPSK